MQNKKNDPTLPIFDQLADNDRKSLHAVFEKRHETIEACGDVLQRTIAFLRNKGWNTHEPIWNAALFLNTVSFDLSVRVEELAYERNEWKRRLTARSLALLLFEIGEDIPAVFGKKFREASTNLGVLPDQLKAVGVETKKISRFQTENRTLLKEIRIIAAAHLDHDAITLHETIENIDLFKLIGLGTKLGSMLNSLGSAVQLIINFASRVEPPEIDTRT